IAILLLNYWLRIPVSEAQEPSQHPLVSMVFSALALSITAPTVWIIANVWLDSPKLVALRALAGVLLLSIVIQFALRLLLARIELTAEEAGVLKQRVLLNCSVFAVALLHSTLFADFGATLLLGIIVGVGFEFALYVFTEQQARIARVPAPAPFRGAPLTLISAGLMALALMGLQGLF
ncbi:MAG: Rnf-Nqr domain containing protein, partial [Steroidobacteraceae bacterium]